MHTLITDGHQATPTWLTAVLRESGHLPQGHVVDVQPQPSPKAVSLIIPLQVRYSEDAPNAAPSRFILKISKPFLNNERPKEIAFYQSIANRVTNLPIIRCYQAVYSPDVGQFHVLLEDLSETHFPHPPSQLPPLKAYSEQIVDALARLHAFWWDDARVGKQIGTLPAEATAQSDVATELAQWAEKTLPDFADFLGDRLSEERRKIYESALRSFPPRLSTRLATGKRLTLIHGDIHIGNFLYPHNPNHDTVRILDWKSWSIDIGADDLAHMMAIFWFPERRSRLEQELLRCYYAHLVEYGVMDYDWPACWYDYRLSVIRYLFYPMWQWSTGASADIWWNHLERVMLAFQDLGCAELLDDER
jgi:thiamine kinase-like enzyme